MKRQSMQPIVASGAKILLLGSMPGEQSLIKQQYYGNKRNHFWPIISDLLNVDLTTPSYQYKCQQLIGHGIALWDVIASCEREGSLDSAIRHEKANDIKGLLQQYPTIRWIGLNGTKAYQSFLKYKKKVDIPELPFTKLPSTSPVPGKNVKSYEEKVEAWREMSHYL
ncbi:DNA-deoxyinosine glycosylase [Salipaludibacillus agaradhaerens]|uniref:DNA-deoxyinosine glycosylase n=1 Tax=Salipaludibacillus agaradhaerens TaxID=76935 RepID=A0A9Q4B0Y2_SALAG|nr:DNA-deoxyinosine glycosylase [Salipaludibacillus agaradhaerens]MCR6096343.1 DNA-deoxyinosine glycosylase [Salipaludibacillus agaradhaerens]MCR6114098.1 DNA-deoxyinosine glycosylase [Salipaludibacillus agaradhaerens]